MQDEIDETWSIGQLAAASGLPVRTIRFYSDAGLLPAQRTTAGHRRYAPADLVRLQLIRSLRSLDVDLGTIAELLAEKVGLQDLLIGHASTLRVRLQALQRQLAVAQAAADAPTGRTLARLHALPRIEAANAASCSSGSGTTSCTRCLTGTPTGSASWACPRCQTPPPERSSTRGSN